MSLKTKIVEHTPAALDACDNGSITGLARNAVEAYVLSGRVFEPQPFPETSPLGRPSACFVCIKTAGRELRGCIGTVEPEHDTLAQEVMANAVKAATRDPRFSPVSKNELPSLLYSVDVLGSLEPTQFEDLNPAAFGVVVTDRSGSRRGLLLPDIESIETAEMKNILTTAINRLPEREKIVITLYYYEGLTLAEIGKVLGVTESRVCEMHT